MRMLKYGLLGVCMLPWLGFATTPAPQRVPRVAAAQPGPAFKILIHKTERKLEVFVGEKKTHEFKVVLGPEPEGTKLRQGDGKTPEGVYFVRVKNPKSQFYLSLGLSYPERHDAERALAEKLISKAQYNRIVSAHDRGENPPSNTPLGGEIFIHGGGTWDGYDWTAGCVALNNPDMKLLFEQIPHGTRVEILP